MTPSIRIFFVAGSVLLGTVVLGGRSADEKLLQGTWEAVSMTQAGKPIPMDEGKVTLTMEGNKLIFKLGSKVMNEGTFSIDAGKKPKTIDVKDKRGTILGIYQLKNDELTMCLAKLGKDRPTDFMANRPTSDDSLVILRRLKAKQ